MGWMLSLLCAAGLSLSLCAEAKAPAMLACPSGASEAACNPSQQDLKEAKAAFAQGMKLEKDSPDKAYHQFEHAAELVPRDIEYITARELARQRLVNNRLERGNAELES